LAGFFVFTTAGAKLHFAVVPALFIDRRSAANGAKNAKVEDGICYHL